MRKRVLLLGDSIRLHYQPYVAKELADVAEVLGPAENCQDSGTLLQNLTRWALERAPDVVHVNCGLHDIRYDAGAVERVNGPERYTQNVAAILERLVAIPNVRVMWATCTPINEIWHNSAKPVRRYEKDVDFYNQLARKVAMDLEVAIDDLHQLVQSAGRDSLLKPDGGHFLESGYELLGCAVATALRPLVSLSGGGDT
jgi:lysophospholipase L1-like esterase